MNHKLTIQRFIKCKPDMMCIQGMYYLRWSVAMFTCLVVSTVRYEK